VKALVVLPSYNESLNIVELTQAILDGDPAHDVCIVDDSSPDGTAALIEEARRNRAGWPERVHLIVRGKKDGRGGAVRDGLAWGMERGDGAAYQAYVEMDCDFSHEPGAIGQGLSMLEQGYDVVIGARYPDGTIIGWPASRRVFSFLANRLARLLIDPSVPDYTNGFRFYRADVVREMLGYRQKHKGYIYLSETLSHLLRSGRRVGAFPIRFRNRERGVSNTSLREIRAALTGILTIAVDHRLRRR
jgi:dolichol-phosphate mannosyltransferase